MKYKVKINHDYFAISKRWKNFEYFLKQGPLVAHLLDRLKWYCCPKLFLTPRFPTHLEIEASSACQLRCPMCKTTEMINAGQIFSGIMDFDLYKKIIDEASVEPLYSIKLSWRGEPLLNPKIVEMVAYAKQKGIKDVAFLTNGEQLNFELGDKLVDAGLDWISVSFDGLKETYEKIRRPAIFEETIAKVKHIREYRDKLGRQKPLIRIQSVHSVIRGQETEFLAVWKDIADRVNIIADQIRSINEQDYCHYPVYICPAPWQRICIGWDGRVAQCYGDYMMGNVLGDVKNQALKQIWKGEPFKQLRELMKNGRRLETKPCRTCSDGGITEEEEIIVDGRRIRMIHYTDQGIDVGKMESQIK